MTSIGSNFFNDLLDYEIKNTDVTKDHKKSVLERVTRAQARLGALWRNNPLPVLKKSETCSGMGKNGIQEPLGGPINTMIDYGFNAPGKTKKYCKDIINKHCCDLPELPFWSLKENMSDENNNVENFIGPKLNNETISNKEEMSNEEMSNEIMSNKEEMSNEEMSNEDNDNNYLMIILIIIAIILIILGVCIAKTA